MVIITFIIPISGVIFGAAAGILFAARALFDSRGRNDMFIDFTGDAERNNIVVNEMWGTFVDTVVPIKKLEVSIKATAAETRKASEYPLSLAQRQRFVDVMDEINQHRTQAIALLAATRDEMLKQEAEQWDETYAKYLEDGRFEGLAYDIKRLIREQVHTLDNGGLEG